jgi:predicted metal-dependent hydrolase
MSLNQGKTQQRIVLPNGEAIDYQLERRQRRTIGLKISAQGLVVHAPKRLSLTQLEHALKDKADWICKKLKSQAANAIAPIAWQDGTLLWLFGNQLQLQIVENPRNKMPDFQLGTLMLALYNPQDQALIARKTIQWYQKQALTDFTRRLALFAAKLDVNTPRLYLSNAKSRWGSCNSKQEIRLSWRLIQAPPHIINYVICHELAHLKEMNHSPKFWGVVKSIYPEYQQAEKDLKQWAAKLHAMQ